MLIIAALAAVPGQAVGQSARSCLTQPEADALVAYALPSAIRAITTKCTPVLPATTALIQSGPIIAARYQIDADKAWPVARIAFDKVSGLDLTGTLGEPAAKGLVEAAFGTGVAEKVKAADCPKVDRLVDILEPLPARNMAMLIAMLMELGSVEKQKKSPFKMCPTLASGR
jgi:hypothetical protein